MKRAALSAFVAIALAVAPSALAVPGGEIGTLPTGRYICELPGDAAGPYRVRTPDEDFAVVSASGYIVNGVRGTYLLTGDTVVMTSGAFKGRQFRQVSDGFLRHLGPAAAEKPMRCVLSTRNNTL